MIYAYKQYTEVFRRNIGPLALDNLGEALHGKSTLGNFLSQQGSLFSGPEIYDLYKETSFLRQFSIVDEEFVQLIKGIEELHDHIHFMLEFLDVKRNSDLVLFSLTKEAQTLSLRAYELRQVAPSLLTEEDFASLLKELSEWKYEHAASLLLLSGGYIAHDEVANVRGELEKICMQKLVSVKTLQLCQFLLKIKQTKKEQFLVMEKYLSVHH